MAIRNLLKQLRNKKIPFLYTSTSEVYGNPPNEFIPTSEEYNGNVASYGPRAMYDESKRAGEAYCYVYSSKGEVPIRIARIFNTYGPRIDVKHPSQYGRVLIKFVHQALEDKPITVYGDGSQTRSFCYVTDQISGLYRLLLTEGIDGEVVNIGNDRETSILELAQKIVLISGSKSTIQTNASPSYNLKDDPVRRNPDISKAKRILSYSPHVSLEEGLLRLINWSRIRQKK